MPDLAWSATSQPALKAKQRNPSHLGSNCQPSPSGNVATDLASIGAVSSGSAKTVTKNYFSTKLASFPSCPIGWARSTAWQCCMSTNDAFELCNLIVGQIEVMRIVLHEVVCGYIDLQVPLSALPDEVLGCECGR